MISSFESGRFALTSSSHSSRNASCAPLMVFQERFATVRTPAIGSSGDFHLQDAEIDAQLQFFATVEPGDFAHFDGAALIGPILQNVIEIQAPRTKHPPFSDRLSITSRLGDDAGERIVAQISTSHHTLVI